MYEYSGYLYTKNMKWVVPYLLKYYFENKPTTNKKLSEAFWKLMGKNIEVSGKQRWTTGKTGVPNQIHRLVSAYILAVVPSENQFADREYPENVHSYVLGMKGQDLIDDFLRECPKVRVDGEIFKYLGKSPAIRS